MIKKNWVYLLFAFAVLLFGFTKFKRILAQRAREPNVFVVTFHTPSGWGYDIYQDDSVYIHQETIPAAEGRKGFESEEDAYMIGNLVKSKMKYSTLPMVSLNELDSCGIER